MVASSTAFAQFTFGPVHYPVGSSPQASVLADLDGDRDLDIAVTSVSPDKVSILFNQGNGTFAPPVRVLLTQGSQSPIVTPIGGVIPPIGGHVVSAPGVRPHTPIAGDFDFDGDDDLAVSLMDANVVQFLFNDGTGSFTLGERIDVGDGPACMKLGDLDQDGDLDLVVANRRDDTVSVLRNDGTGHAFVVTPFPAGQGPRGIDLGDFDRDGRLDMAIAAFGSDGIVLLRNDGSATFVMHALLPTPGAPEDVTMARIDANGSLDMAIADTGDPQGIVVVFLNDGNGAFAFGGGFPMNGRESLSIVDADFDADGVDDLAAASAASNEVALFRNVGDANFDASQLIGVGSRPVHLTVGDVDMNGGKDIVVTNQESGSVTVLHNGNCCESPMDSICQPGEAGAMACPCGNDPSSPGRGCDNSAGTGGARLSATGNASLADDTVVFTTVGERANAPSILLQGTAENSDGTMFGQGVQCVAGLQKRLYTRAASSGSITVPSPNEPSVSERSASLGDPITPGQDRFYLVYYRDPIVDVDCPGTGTFNATQGGRVTWAP